MQGGERNHPEAQDQNFANHQVSDPQLQQLTFPNQKSLGRNSTPLKDGNMDVINRILAVILSKEDGKIHNGTWHIKYEREKRPNVMEVLASFLETKT